ncbi:alpha/beta fold hydrolase [Actinomadura barringtoniae]|uniref:Alpha/beta fold hydrolase n=1 Tax=Actinomadura barringtoniae TaxID=1427535 RepID=A0A939PQR6_9ACTN|nr:alpha/beta hydrolase [Actinomadura barringtoniae]MBO2454439.1 alpha/beta fold hydrolase [Actinomadura barringtoniae]
MIRITAALAAGVAAAGLLTAPAFAAPHTASSLDWKPCKLKPTDADGAECATLRLPVDWARPDGPKFDLALARRKATGARIGNLVFGPGGPGDSGREKVISTPTSRFSPEMLKRFDVVSFDPRGIGGSNPITCSADLLKQRPLPMLKNQADFDANLAYNRKLAADCRAHTPNGIYDHADTSSMAKDLDAIRSALGDDKLTYHGSSYGTLLGQQYAEQHPDRIRAMVLESVIDRSSPNTHAFLKTSAITAQDSFNQFVKWCEQAKCDPDIRATWKKKLATAEPSELFYLVNKIAFKSLYGPDWPGLAKAITQPAAQAEQAAAPAPTATDPTQVFCSDWNLPIRDYRDYSRQVRRMTKAAPDLPYLLPLQMTLACQGSKAINPQHRLRIGKTPQILLINSLHDPATAYPWAVSVSRQIGRQGILLTYDGAGHGSSDSGPCMQNATDDYLINLTTPARGTHCPAVQS